jgi:hypothetical protein
MRSFLAVLAVALAALLPAAVYADPVERHAGGYTLTVDWAEDPPYLEDGNAIAVRVVDAAGQPVSGLENELGLEVDITVDPVTRTSALDVRPSLDEPGVYEGVFAPPVIGKYDFRVFGSINGTKIDERFVTGQGLAEVTVADGYNWGGAGELLAAGILFAYVAGLGGFGLWWLRRRRARRTSSNPA